MLLIAVTGLVGYIAAHAGKIPRFGLGVIHEDCNITASPRRTSPEVFNWGAVFVAEGVSISDAPKNKNGANPVPIDYFRLINRAHFYGVGILDRWGCYSSRLALWQHLSAFPRTLRRIGMNIPGLCDAEDNMLMSNQVQGWSPAHIFNVDVGEDWLPIRWSNYVVFVVKDCAASNRDDWALFNCVVGNALACETSLPSSQSSVDDYSKERAGLNERVPKNFFIVAGVVLFTLSIVFIYKIWSKVNFDFTPDMNVACYVALVLVAAIIAWIGMTLCGIGLNLVSFTSFHV
jgi:hypothetical protein